MDPFVSEEFIVRVDVLVETATVNGADADLDAASIAVIVWLPVVAAGGKTTDPGNPPFASAVINAGVVAMLVPSNVADTAEFGVKFVPAMLTVLVTSPLTGFSDIAAGGGAGTVTVNGAAAVPLDASVALIVCDPVIED